jgi:hypothetical protein
MSASSATNVWAVGTIYTTNGQVALHWNRTKWQEIAYPEGLAYGKSAWAVGAHDNVARDTNTSVMLHTSGGAWKAQASFGANFSLSSISAASSKQVYSVGYCYNRPTGIPPRTLLEFFNRHSWRGQPTNRL